MRGDEIQNQQEEHADQKADGGRNEGEPPQLLCHFERRIQKTPEGSGDHDAGGKTGQGLADSGAHFTFQKEDTGGTQCRSRKRNQNTDHGTESDCPGHKKLLDTFYWIQWLAKTNIVFPLYLLQG